jgi:hypothetical protein
VLHAEIEHILFTSSTPKVALETDCATDLGEKECFWWIFLELFVATSSNVVSVLLFTRLAMAQYFGRGLGTEHFAIVGACNTKTWRCFREPETVNDAKRSLGELDPHLALLTGPTRLANLDPGTAAFTRSMFVTWFQTNYDNSPSARRRRGRGRESRWYHPLGRGNHHTYISLSSP